MLSFEWRLPRHWGRLVLTSALVLLIPQAALAIGLGGLPDFTEMVRQYSPAVVNISTRGSSRDERAEAGPEGDGQPQLPDDYPLDDRLRRFFEGPTPKEDEPEPEDSAAVGSGFIVSSDGYIISNFHVVKGAEEIVVRMPDRREFKAKLVGGDARSDIAVLKVAATGELPVVKLGRSQSLQVGEWVLAIGSPFGFEHSVTAGIVSAKGRSLPNDNYVPFIQTDVAINPGNSGGPLFNLAGEVVGVNAQIFSRTGGFMGLSFAIPIDVAMNVYRQLRDKGVFARGWLGVLIQDVTGELAESFKMTTPRGALISKVLPSAPAAAAGIQAGDVILKFNGADIALATDLPPLVGATSVGQNIPVEILRDGKSRQITVTIGQLPESEPQAGGSADKPKAAAGQFEEQLKIRVRALSDAERREMEIKGPGVVVDKIKPGPAAQAGLLVGDILAQLNFKEIKAPQDLAAALKSVPPGTKVPVLIYREGNPLFLALEIPKA